MDIDKNSPCPNCGRFDNRGISVDLIVIRNQKILLAKRNTNPFKNYWGIIGGYIDWDENPEQAAARELKEETGLQLISLKLLRIYGDPKRHPKQVITIAYIAETEGEPLTTQELSEFKWCNQSEIPDKLGFDHYKILQDYFNR